MGSSLVQDFKIGNHHQKMTRKNVRLQLDLLPAFEGGLFHDCTIRVGCDLQNSDLSFRVCIKKTKQLGLHIFNEYYFNRTSDVTS
jgi:hypothetical protein